MVGSRGFSSDEVDVFESSIRRLGAAGPFTASDAARHLAEDDALPSDHGDSEGNDGEVTAVLDALTNLQIIIPLAGEPARFELVID